MKNMPHFTDKNAYRAYLDAEGRLPRGFRTSIDSFTFHPAERESADPLKMNLALIALDNPTEAFTGMFTRNAFPGAPVTIGRRRLQGISTRGVLVNNRVSNVLSPGGEAQAEALLDELALQRGEVSREEWFPSSTGIIGWGLPLEEMKMRIPRLIKGLNRNSALGAAEAIMTTDGYPKLRSISLGEGRIVGLAKGAGMIEPNMATMLVFILTDLDVPRHELEKALRQGVNESFNCISIDSDQSTSDTVLLFSSGEAGKAGTEEFAEALTELCRGLSLDVVRNGEGTAHVLRVGVHTSPSVEFGRALGKAVVNSPLVKTAVYGNDPNVGRLASAVGDFLGNNGPHYTFNLPQADQIEIFLGGERVYSRGGFTLSAGLDEKLSRYLQHCALPQPNPGYPAHQRSVEIDIHLNAGNEEAEVWGSDLSYEYVHENADYRS